MASDIIYNGKEVQKKLIMATNTDGKVFVAKVCFYR